jgi:hypothetical protein
LAQIELKLRYVKVEFEICREMTMESRIAGMIGAAALVAVGAGSAAAAPSPNEVLQANSFAELLQPVSNASVLLAKIDTTVLPAAGEEEGANRQMMAYHHHHHHHRWWRRRHHHHHHHHHQW